MDRTTSPATRTKRTKKSTRTKKPVTHVTDSADALQTLDRLTIRLEGGGDAEMNIAAELSIPDGRIEQSRELVKAPSRLAFWAYQRDRARLKLRERERQLKKLEADAGIACRRYLDDGHNDEAVKNDWSSKTFGLIGDMVNQQEDVHEERTAVNQLRYEYDVLNTVTQSMEQKCFALRRLVSFNAERDAL